MRAAVIGTGIMGSGMARSLAREGHDVAVWNRTRERAEELAGDGTTVVGSVGEAVQGADAVVTMLFDADSVLGVVPELVESLGDAVWLQSSTVGPQGARRIAEAAGVAHLDAPVLGTRVPAENGALTVLLAGPADLRERATPVTEAIGSRVVLAGDEVGRASALKLACNAWIGTITAGAAQSLALAQALGVDPRLFLETIEGGPLDAPYLHTKGGLMLDRAWPTSFAVDGVRKDVGLMIEAGRAAGVRDDLLQAVLALFDAASELGHGGDDMAAVRTAFDA